MPCARSTQGADHRTKVEKSVQAATSAQAADLKTVQEARQTTAQQVIDLKSQVQVMNNNLNKVTGDPEALKGEVAAAAKPSALPWIAGGLALALGIVALARRRA